MKKFKIPDKCPSCGWTLKRVKDQLFCKNTECAVQLERKIVSYCNILGIKGFGPKIVERLNFKSILDLYTHNEEYYKSILGEKMGQKLHNALNDKIETDQATYLAAFSIPLVGKTTAEKISKPLEEVTYDSLMKDGIGDKTSKNIIYFLKTTKDKYELINRKLKVNFAEKTTNRPILKVCITGKIRGYTKKDIADILSKYNVEVTQTIGLKTNYLICDEEKNSNKEIAAKKYKIPIIKYGNFLEKIRHGTT